MTIFVNRFRPPYLYLFIKDIVATLAGFFRHKLKQDLISMIFGEQAELEFLKIVTCHFSVAGLVSLTLKSCHKIKFLNKQGRIPRH